jgi:hypothetical protein
MQPTTARDFLKVALHRLDRAVEIAEILRRTPEAQDIGGGPPHSLQALSVNQNKSGRITPFAPNT